MDRFLILVGGELHESPRIRQLAGLSYRKIIAGDSGLMWAYRLGIVPDQMLGDFDSVSGSVLEYFLDKKIPHKEYPARKDYTDSELALSVALDQAGPGDKVVILGGLGGRLDHTLSNIFLLLRGEKENVDVLLCDGFNEVQLIRGPSVTHWDPMPSIKYFSLIPFEGPARGVTLEGFSYPLDKGCLLPGYTLGNSNEVLEGGGTVTLEEGSLLVVRCADRKDLYGDRKENEI